ncbi:hypothetical protein PIB30_045341, partial [Stylosanthes scabra]|nr:hypothetical protein [Stylosanthes scabra]
SGEFDPKAKAGTTLALHSLKNLLAGVDGVGIDEHKVVVVDGVDDVGVGDDATEIGVVVSLLVSSLMRSGCSVGGHGSFLAFGVVNNVEAETVEGVE